MAFQPYHDDGAVRILVADGRPDVRSALRLLLEQDTGMVVSAEARKGDDVVEQVRVTCPDVIILDCDLPGLQARDLLPEVRSICPRVWVVALCSRAEARRAVMSAGADVFVSKSDYPQKLLKIVRQGCRGRASEGPGKLNGQQLERDGDGAVSP